MEILTIALSPNPPRDIRELLETLFWRDKKMASEALELIDHIREWNRSSSPYKASDWEAYCLKTGMAQRRYHSILKRLKCAGMIEKRYNKNGFHEIMLSGRFSDTLSAMSAIWDRHRSS